MHRSLSLAVTSGTSSNVNETCSPSVAVDVAVAVVVFGLINTLDAISKTFAPILTGLLAVKLGIRRTLLLGMLLIAFAILPPLATTIPLFLAGRLIFGLGVALLPETGPRRSRM